jgi:hypothetical protein
MDNIVARDPNIHDPTLYDARGGGSEESIQHRTKAVFGLGSRAVKGVET